MLVNFSWRADKLWKSIMFVGQFADKPTRGQSSHGLVSSWTSELANSEFFLNHRKTKLYFMLNINLTLTITLSTNESVQ